MTSAMLITALVYQKSVAADSALEQIAAFLKGRGLKLAGLIQENRESPPATRCDMMLKNVATGKEVKISQERGQDARGCMLDVGQLLAAMQQVRASLGEPSDLFILNKFGVSESEGGGLRPLIAEIIEAGKPLLIAVSERNLVSFREFAGGFSREYRVEELPRDSDALCRALALDRFAQKGPAILQAALA